MAAQVPPYMDYAVQFEADPGYGEHVAKVLAEVAHRLTCPLHFDRLCGGSSGVEVMNRVIDAQLDLLIAAYGGDGRVALASAVQALGRAAALLGKQLREDEL